MLAAVSRRVIRLCRQEEASVPVSYAAFLGLVVAGVVVAATLLVPTRPVGGFDLAVALQCGAILAGCGLLAWRNGRAPQAEHDADHDDDSTEPTEEQYDAKLMAKRQHILRALCKNSAALGAGRVTVRHLMSTKLTTVPPTATIEEIRSLMQTHGLRHLLVTDVGQLVGVISDRDVNRAGRTARDIMARKPLSVSPETLVNPAVALMTRKRISCLPIVENGELCGLFTTTDLVMTLQCAFQLLQSVAPYLEQPDVQSAALRGLKETSIPELAAT